MEHHTAVAEPRLDPIHAAMCSTEEDLRPPSELYDDYRRWLLENPKEQIAQLKWEIGAKRRELRRVRCSLRRERPSRFLKLLRLFQWAAQPSSKKKPRSAIPGIGLDLTIAVLFVVIGVANLMV